MLSRHFLRAKVLQALYANKISESTDLKTSIKELTDSISSIYNLEVYLYSALLEIRDIAENQIEDAKTKFLPTEEDLNPNMRFVNNSLLRQLSENMELKGAVKRLKIDWNAEKDILRRVFNQFKNSDSYKEYMEKDVIGYEDDKQVVTRLFKNYMLKNEPFMDYLFGLQTSWESDFQFVGLSFIKYLKDFSQDDTAAKPLPDFFYTDEHAREFVEDLFSKIMTHFDEYDQMIKKRVENWDMDRLAFLDILIIKMGLVELEYCPAIPVRVTMNEYIELAKEFSTDRSKLFVNGLLDKLLVDMRSMGRIRKDEQGLETMEEYS